MAHAFLAVIGVDVGDLMTQHGRQTRFRLADRQQPRVNDHLAAGHGERVDIRVYDQVELPLVVRERVLLVLRFRVVSHRLHDLRPDPLDHRGRLRVRAPLAGGDDLVVLLEARGHDIRLRDKAQLLASRDAHLRTPRQHHQQQTRPSRHHRSRDLLHSDPPCVSKSPSTKAIPIQGGGTRRLSLYPTISMVLPQRISPVPRTPLQTTVVPSVRRVTCVAGRAHTLSASG